MRRPEEALHRSLVAQLRARLPEPWLVWHTPNGGGRSKAEAGILKAMGTLAGMPDLFVLGPTAPVIVPANEVRPGERGLILHSFPRLIAIELKAPPSRPGARTGAKRTPKVSPAQKATIARLGACGVPTLVVDNIDDALKGLVALGVPLKGRVP